MNSVPRDREHFGAAAWRGVHDRGIAVHDRGGGSRRLEIDRQADRVTLGLFVPQERRSMPNERISMSKLKQLIALQASNLSVRAIARALGPVGRCGLEVFTGGARGGDQPRRCGDAAGERARAAGIRPEPGRQAAEVGAAGLLLDPHGAQAPSACDAAAAVGRVRRAGMGQLPTGAAPFARATGAGSSG